MSQSSDNHLDAHKLTWAVLLGKWVEFARSAVALPDDPQGRRLKVSVPDMIMLQAVWFALHHMDELSASEQALGCDRAAVLIEQHEQRLHDCWSPDPLPEKVGQLVDDARQMLVKVTPQSPGNLPQQADENTVARLEDQKKYPPSSDSNNSS